MPDRREHADIETAFGDQDLRCLRLDTRDGGEQLDDLSVRREHELDPLAQAQQRRVERVDVREKSRPMIP